MRSGWKRLFSSPYAFLIAVGLLSFSALGFSQEIVQDQPDIFFPEREISFGVGWRGEEISSTFVYENHGAADLVVEAVKPVCGQRVTDAGARRVPAGDRGEIKVYVTLGNHVGPQRFPFLVESNDLDSPEVTLELSGVVATGAR